MMIVDFWNRCIGLRRSGKVISVSDFSAPTRRSFCYPWSFPRSDLLWDTFPRGFSFMLFQFHHRNHHGPCRFWKVKPMHFNSTANGISGILLQLGLVAFFLLLFMLVRFSGVQILCKITPDLIRTNGMRWSLMESMHWYRPCLGSCLRSPIPFKAMRERERENGIVVMRK